MGKTSEFIQNNCEYKRMNIFITGATGFVGNQLIDNLKRSKHQLFCLSRTSHTNSENTHYIKGNLNDLSNISLKDIDIVIHLASISNGTKESYHQTNVIGTQSLIQQCLSGNLKQFIYISSICALSSNPNDAYGKSKLEAEKIVVKSKLNWTILRPAEVIGKQSKFWNFLINTLKNKKSISLLGSGNQQLAPVHIDNLTFAIINIIGNKNTYQKNYFITGESISQQYFYLTIKEEYQLKYKINHIPHMLIQLLNLFKFILPLAYKNKIIALQQLSQDRAYSYENANKDFNYKPTFFKESVKKTIIDV